MQTQAQVYAAKYAQTIARQMIRTIRLVRWAAILISLVGMGVSYSHQAHYLVVIGMTAYAAWLIPGALDSLTFICVKVLSTAAVTRSARITAGVMLVFPVSVSCVVNFVAPGVLLVKVAFVIAVLLIPAAEIVASRLRPDFRAMHLMELELYTFGGVAAEAQPSTPGPATAPVVTVPDTVAELEEEAEGSNAPVSPAGAAIEMAEDATPSKPRGPYGPRKGDEYSRRHKSRLESGK